MSAKVFFDTNILVYSYSVSELEKQAISRRLIAESNSFISTQVIQELTNIITKKFKFSFNDALNAIKDSCSNNDLYTNNVDIIRIACTIADKYRFSFYDSLIVAAALSCKCTVLF